MKNFFLKSAFLAGVTVLSFIGLSDSKALASEGEGSVVNNVYNLDITSADYVRLVNLGFTEDQIINMDLEEFNLNKDLEGEIVAEDKKFIKIVEYHESVGGVSTFSNGANVNRLVPKSDSSTEFVKYELTEEEYYRQVEQVQQQNSNTFKLDGESTLSTPGYSFTTTSYHYLTTTIGSLGSNRYRVKHNVYWNVMPKNRDFDLIGALITDQWSPILGTEYGKQTWTLYHHRDGSYTEGSATYSSSKDSSYWNLGSLGYSVKMNLKDNDEILISQQGYMGYRVAKTDMYMYFTVSPVVSNFLRIEARGRYAHAITKISPNISFSVTAKDPGFTINVNKTSDFTYYHGPTHAVITF